MTFISFVLLFNIAFAGTVNSTRVIDLNKEGAELLKKEQFQSAQEKFMQAMGKSPFSAELQVNLGLAFDGAGNPEKTKQAYEQALRMPGDDNVKFTAAFNMGELFGREKNIDEALKYYQMALDSKPDSIEAKTNIELLMQQKDDKNKNGKDGDKKKDDKDKNKKNDGKQNDKNDDKKNDKNDDNKDDKKQYEKNKPQPRPFKSEDLSPGDVKKILEELDRQEQRVRAEYNKKQVKERPRDKDW